MLNLKLNKPSPILPKGAYQATIARYHEAGNVGILTILINNKPYKIWLKDNPVNINGETTIGAQIIMDSICQQVANDNPQILEMVETSDELIMALMQAETQLIVWVTVYEDQYNNMSFYKPKNWDAETALGI